MSREWNLNPKQRRVAEMLALGDPETGEYYTKVKICEETGLARSTLYEWLHNSEFVEYVNFIADMGVESRVSEYYAQLNKLIFSAKPSVKALELVFKIMGKLKDNVKVDATVAESKSISHKSIEEMEKDIALMRESLGLTDE